MTTLRTYPTNELLGIPESWIVPQDSSPSSDVQTESAIVIGAGISGLLATAVLSRHVDSVALLDRDSLPETSQHRRGIPHGRHVHGLMARGRGIIDDLFPGITDELHGFGALPVDGGVDVRWFQEVGHHCEARSGVEMLAVSRPLLEFRIRARVAALPNVTIYQDSPVTGLVVDGPGQPVSGVKLDSTKSSGLRMMRADLVIDASGRGSQLPAWLTSLGYESPDETVIDVDTNYATWMFHRRPGQAGGKPVTVIVASPANRRGGVALAQEGNQWLVTLAGRAGIKPPSDLDAFIKFAGKLPAPDIYELVRDAEPVGEAATYHFPGSRRRFYERMVALPDGVLPIGDAICGFNPIYAQGMSIAAIEAQELDRCLKHGQERLAPRLFDAIIPAVNTAWKLAAASDYRYTSVRPPRKVQAINWYMARLHVAARSEPRIAHAFSEVVNLLAEPSTLMQPSMAALVLRGNARGLAKYHGWRHTEDNRAQDGVPTPRLAR